MQIRMAFLSNNNCQLIRRTLLVAISSLLLHHPCCSDAFLQQQSTFYGTRTTCQFKGSARSFSPEDDETFPSSSSSASVGDYVMGVHGGKYQFEEAGGASFAGQQFAESLYASDSSEGVIEAKDGTEEPFPRWANVMGTSEKLGTVIVPPRNKNSFQSFRLRNNSLRKSQ